MMHYKSNAERMRHFFAAGLLAGGTKMLSARTQGMKFRGQVRTMGRMTGRRSLRSVWRLLRSGGIGQMCAVKSRVVSTSEFQKLIKTSTPHPTLPIGVINKRTPWSIVPIPTMPVARLDCSRSQAGHNNGP